MIDNLIEELTKEQEAELEKQYDLAYGEQSIKSFENLFKLSDEELLKLQKAFDLAVNCGNTSNDFFDASNVYKQRIKQVLKYEINT